MNRSVIPHAVADIVVITHGAFVAFVAIGLLLIICGGFRRWNWIRPAVIKALRARAKAEHKSLSAVAEERLALA